MKEYEGQLITNEAFSAMSQAAGNEEGCEKSFARQVNYCQCEVCKHWGERGEMVYVTDNGDLCEAHLGHQF